MARQNKILIEDIQRGRQLRDQATTVVEYRKSPDCFHNRGHIRNQGCTPKNSCGGRQYCTLTIEEEREFLVQWIAEATIGGVLTVPPIHVALVERLGRDSPISTTYRLLECHSWRKVQPDTEHLKSDTALQDEFKNIFLKQ
jgi:hypothetical protein